MSSSSFPSYIASCASIFVRFGTIIIFFVGILRAQSPPPFNSTFGMEIDHNDTLTIYASYPLSYNASDMVVLIQSMELICRQSKIIPVVKILSSKSPLPPAHTRPPYYIVLTITDQQTDNFDFTLDFFRILHWSSHNKKYSYHFNCNTYSWSDYVSYDKVHPSIIASFQSFFNDFLKANPVK
jgi:hypothetical protein